MYQPAMSATGSMDPTIGLLDPPSGTVLDDDMMLDESTKQFQSLNLLSTTTFISDPNRTTGETTLDTDIELPDIIRSPSIVALDTVIELPELIISPPTTLDSGGQSPDAIPEVPTNPPDVQSSLEKQLSSSSLDFLGITPSSILSDIDLKNLSYKAKDMDFAITTVFWAAINKHNEAMRIILQHGAGFDVMSEPSNKKRTRKIIHKAKQRPSQYNIDAMMKAGTDLAITIGPKRSLSGPNAWITALHWTVKKNNPLLLRQALELGVRVNQPDCEGYTALHWASWMDDETAARILLEYGASVGVRDAHGRVPLDDAVEAFMKATDAVKKKKYNPPWLIWLLLENEPNRHFKQSNNWMTPLLHLAVMFSHKTLVTDLLDPFYEVGAVDINIRDTIGRTALHMAAKASRMDIVFLLLDKGADCATKDNASMTALDHAPKGGEIATLLAALGKPGYQPLVRDFGVFIIPDN